MTREKCPTCDRAEELAKAAEDAIASQREKEKAAANLAATLVLIVDHCQDALGMIRAGLTSIHNSAQPEAVPRERIN